MTLKTGWDEDGESLRIQTFSLVADVEAYDCDLFSIQSRLSIGSMGTKPIQVCFN